MKEYTIRGGDEGAKRLNILSRTIQNSTKEFLKAAGLQEEMNCLNLGCGSGSVTLILADIVGFHGQVLGLDIDERNIQIATELALVEGIKNVDFKCFDVYKLDEKFKYDIIYSRFLLSHLTDPKTVLQNSLQALTAGGKLLIEDTDFTGHFSNPQSNYFDQYVSLYQNLLKKKGANANLGQNLIWLLKEIGFTEIEFQISQPAHISEEGKLMAEITFAGISQALIEEELVTQKEYLKIHSELVKFRKRKDTMMSLPRIFQVTAKCPY